jgi:anti-sigma factor RsiW
MHLTRSQLETYLDGELSTHDMRELDSHLRTCPSCAADVLALVQTKRAVHSAGKRYSPSPEFRDRIRKTIAAKPQRSPVRLWLAAASAFALLLIAGFVTVSVRQQQLAQQHTFSELADLHVATLASANPVDVISTDRHTVKPWFQGRIPFTFNLPELQNSEFTLLGGRVTYLGQSPGAELIFQIRKHQISVFIFQDRAADAFGTTGEAQKAQSFNTESWSQNGLSYFVIGDASGDDIRDLSELLKKAAQQ